MNKFKKIPASMRCLALSIRKCVHLWQKRNKSKDIPVNTEMCVTEMTENQTNVENNAKEFEKNLIALNFFASFFFSLFVFIITIILWIVIVTIKIQF